jgi:sugar O-acyltransferase (sialic acid O-acetyltransferase NeuD family)
VRVSEKILVIGASTPTIIRVVDDINQSGGRRLEILGFLDNAHETLGTDYHGHEILGGFDAVGRFKAGQVLLINTIAGSIASRVETTEHFLALGYRFTNIAHPGVNTKYVSLGTGNLIYENALIQPFVTIGNHCVISSNSGIAHETSIADYCFVGPASYVCGKVTVAERVYIGTGARILPRLTIGKGARIGSSALVNKPVLEGLVILGIPGRAR